MASSKLYRVLRGPRKPKSGDDNGCALVGDFTTRDLAERAAAKLPLSDDEHFYLEPLSTNADTKREDWTAHLEEPVVYRNDGKVEEL